MKYTAREFPDKTFESLNAMHKAIVDHLPELEGIKKSAVKFTDGLTVSYKAESVDREISHKELAASDDPTTIRRKVVMNTTNLLDSHGDVHINGIWKRTLSHSSKKLHLQEHKREFDKVIASDAIAYTKTMSWKSLGADYEGSTQALVFDTTIKQSRNPMMFEQYKNGWVENHSVGMQYVDYQVCINSGEEWAKPYKENWDKYYPLIVNKEDADATGYFWAILEAKLIEGSAVLMGSNWVTPTLENKSEPGVEPLSTIEPEQSTRKNYYESLI